MGGKAPTSSFYTKHRLTCDAAAMRCAPSSTAARAMTMVTGTKRRTHTNQTTPSIFRGRHGANTVACYREVDASTTLTLHPLSPQRSGSRSKDARMARCKSASSPSDSRIALRKSASSPSAFPAAKALAAAACRAGGCAAPAAEALAAAACEAGGCASPAAKALADAACGAGGRAAPAADALAAVACWAMGAAGRTTAVDREVLAAPAFELLAALAVDLELVAVSTSDSAAAAAAAAGWCGRAGGAATILAGGRAPELLDAVALEEAASWRVAAVGASFLRRRALLPTI
mmetsp:Transcript_37654/g.117337  ORF Transcript_37654/g.117337 Transcript_37654/m.117337 type:complete len:289 (+) Transcript_37654:162-1028(+)